MLQALEPLGHTPALTEHLSHAAPGVLHDVARTLCALGLDSYSTADWAALVPADDSDPGTSEEDEEAGAQRPQHAAAAPHQQHCRPVEERVVRSGAQLPATEWMHGSQMRSACRRSRCACPA